VVADERERSPAALLAGRYILGEPFASGGMGSVHLGRIVGASGFSRVVAIKRLFPGFATDASFRQMMLDEANVASRIRHPNVVPILDVVEAEGNLYLVMEYVHGLSLAELLDRPEPVPTDMAAAIVEAVLLGLHAAHEARDEGGGALGIVHRDVSPQNVLLGGDGVPRLIDFGIAKAASRIQVTDPGILKGKAGYMAPEQLLHEPVARHADVFSASVVLWEMLAGRPLFPYDIGERVRRAGEPVSPPSYHRAGIDPALDAVVLRGLARDPDRRFPTAEAMAIELRRDRALPAATEVARWLTAAAGDQLEISDERVRLFEREPTVRSPDSSRGSALLTSVATPVSEISSRADRRRGRGWLVAGIGAAVVAAVLAFELVPRRAPPPPIPVADSVAVTSALAPPPSAVLPDLPPTPVPRAARSASSAAGKPPSGRPHAAGKPKCDPPYTVDSDGFKHYDPSCF
jgi:eukaryotic-like serine/threonine-protein kinase